MYRQNDKDEPRRERRRHVRVSPPIVNVGRICIDWPTRDRSRANLLKFFAFIALLLGLFALLYAVQAQWLMSMNSRKMAPAWQKMDRAP